MNNEVRHKYEYDVDLNSGSAAARIIRMIGRDKRVLEIGAGPGSITRLLYKHNGCRVTALEIDTDAIEILKAFCERVYQADLDDVSWPKVLQNEDKFDVVLAGDVLEHLRDPWSVLASMGQLVGESGYILISLPHVGHCSVLACMLENNFDYQDCGLLDRTHIRFFGIKNIQQMFVHAGLKIIAAEFVVKRPEDTEFTDCWKRTPWYIRRVLSAKNFGMVYQVVIKAVPAQSPGAQISLLDLPVERPEKR